MVSKGSYRSDRVLDILSIVNGPLMRNEINSPRNGPLGQALRNGAQLCGTEQGRPTARAGRDVAAASKASLHGPPVSTGNRHSGQRLGCRPGFLTTPASDALNGSRAGALRGRQGHGGIFALAPTKRALENLRQTSGPMLLLTPVAPPRLLPQAHHLPLCRAPSEPLRATSRPRHRPALLPSVRP